ncbi:MAG: primosomal protein N' [Anaerolineales bacterium]|nr:primosomal protein N' [Anaerolineales bacterium]
MKFFAQIAVNVPSVAGVFDYAIPEDLAGGLGIGQLVIVPFSKQTVQGVILRFIDQPSIADTKEILEIVDPDPVLTSAQIALAEWMAGATLSPLAAIINLMLPVGLGQQADVLYGIRDSGIGNQQSEIENRKSQVENRLLSLLTAHGSLRGRQIDTHFRNVDWRKSAEWLVKRGILVKKSVLPSPRVRSKYIRVAQLAVSLEEAVAALPDLGTTEATQKRRSAALRYLMRELDEVNVSWVYAESGCNLSDLQLLAERGLIVLRENEVWRDPLERVERRGLENSSPPKLTPEQEQAWEKIRSAFTSRSTRLPFLLHGVTGSGKTELYIRAAEEAVRRGRQAIILVPEIALTPQTVRRFLARFPGQVGLIHSKLSEGERYDTWRRARANLLKVIIGPRSALFAPLPDIGLIAVDECHDGSYYQSEPPFYHAVEAAKAYAKLCGAVFMMGSATPSIVQRWSADAGESVRLDLPRRIASAQETKPHQHLDLPPVSVIDMREELKAGNRGIFSRDLLQALGDTLNRGEQAILFLNRRGTATYVFCRDCGYTLKCPQCDNPLTYHVIPLTRDPVDRTTGKPENALTCHFCGYSRQKPTKCLECGSKQIREYGLGSERVETEVGTLFPGARVLRWDWETTRQKDAHEIILSHFASHRADVLVGTQMLAKGLDLPLVTLVGIVLADVGLNLPDPFSSERVFQVLTQVAGRAGRSTRGGRVILQTFQPEHPVIRAASGHDYSGFYEQELAGRRRLGYPPFGRLVRLEYRHRDNARAEVEARKTADRLKSKIDAERRTQTTLVGPVPCFFAKLRGEYRWQIVLRGPNLVEVLQGQRFDGWRVEVHPTSLL